MNVEQLRAEFEAWYRRQYIDSEPLIWVESVQAYRDFDHNQIFGAYQAGRAALQSQDREDAARIEFLEKEWFYRNTKGVWAFGFSELWDAGQHESLREAIDHARRVEGEL